MSKPSVGFIGIGIMGRAMAGHVLEAGNAPGLPLGGPHPLHDEHRQHRDRHDLAARPQDPAGDLLVVERVDPVFFSDPMTAAMKALGMT